VVSLSDGTMNVKLVLATLSGALIILSCDPKDEVVQEEEKSVIEQVESKAMGILSTMERLPAALMNVKDEASLKVAEKEIEAIRADLAQKAEELEKLPKLDATAAAEIENRLETAGEKLKDDMTKVMAHLQSLKNPALMMEVGKLMQSFGEDMSAFSEKMEKVFKS